MTPQRRAAMPVHEYNPRRVVAGLVFVIVGVAFLLEDAGVWTVDLVYVWPLMLIGLGTSVLMGHAKRQKVEEDRSEQLAVAEERVRIARELHDIVSHSVSLMTVQIAAARRVSKKKPDAAEAALEAAEQTGRQSLAELRNIVTVLRSADASIEAASLRHDHEPDELDDNRAPMPGLHDIKTLVDGMKEAGVEVSYSVLGVQPDVPPGIGLVVYRVVQEALTNVIRHAHATQAEVSIMYLPDSIDIRIEDNGLPPNKPRSSDGHGLMGMRERVATVLGTVTCGPKKSGNGWEVHAEIPLGLVTA